LRKFLGVGLTGQGGLGGVSTAAGIAGSMVGGLLIARFSLKRALAPIARIPRLAILIYVALATQRPPLPWIVAAVVLEQLIAGVGTAALMVFLMRLCDREHKAAHFAIGTSLMSVATTGFG